MQTESHPFLLSSFQLLSRLASAIVVLVGCIVLVGWGLDIGLLKSLHPAWVTMKANTALGFVLAGLSLWLLQVEPTPSSPKELRRRLATFCALVVVLLGLLTLGEYFFGRNLGIDQLLFEEPRGAVGTSQPGRMAPSTALCFLLLGAALLFVDRQTRRGQRPAQLLALASAVVSLLTLVSFSYGRGSLLLLPAYTQMALHTALAFLVLAAGLLSARPDRGLMAVITSESAGGMLARRLLPAAIAVPLLLGWLRLLGQRAGLYQTEFGTSLHVLLVVILFSVLTYWHARSLDRSDSERRRAQEELDRFFTLSPELHCIAGFDGYFKRFNPAWEKALGWSTAELLAQPYVEFVHPDDRPKTAAEAANLGQGQETISFENRYRRRDGSYVWLLWKATPLADAQLIYAAARDITLRKRVEEALRQRSDELTAANQELEAFTYSVSHDLRAPLRHIDGFTKLLLEEHSAGLSEEARHYLQRVREGTQQMGQLVDDLLSLSRVGRQELRRQACRLDSLVEEARAALQAEAKDREVDWRIGPLPFVECDPALMKQVFSNLLSNALKFTRPRERPCIEVGQTTVNGHPTVFVRDNGVGFSMKYADKLFGVFQRLHRQEDFEGTGVGLATVQRIIHKHGGRVWAEGELDKGATFYFSLGVPENSGPDPQNPVPV